MNTLTDLLRQQAGLHPDEVALVAPGRPPLTYSALVGEVDNLISYLAGRGLGQGDRIALALPDGPELAVAFLATAAGFCCAPLNPRYRREEFEFYLADLGARALITSAEVGEQAREAAEGLGLEVLNSGDTIGNSKLASRSAPNVPARRELRMVSPELPGPDDTALLLHTSGTTSRPKLVPLTQRNLCLSAANVAASLALTPADRCLCVMPLFHIHGLVAALLASLTAGGSVVCAPGFVATEFFDWVVELRPTWYTAVPTMHQALLARAARYPELIAARPFRFIRSCSAALPVSVMEQLEKTWGAPVIEAYGMTEAAHQIACSPLPPRRRKPGSVGVAAGPQVAIMDEQGKLLGPDEVGEIVIQGPNLTHGYESNPQANESAFCQGWFRTGDEGFLDPEGYLFIRGRIKEIINRGGEKISPREVDEVLLAHPAVAQALTFAIPDDLLGEEIGAAVVLREGEETDEATLRREVSQHLADFKVPRRVIFLDELPRGATGKLQRIGLAERLAVSSATPSDAAETCEYVAPSTRTQELLCAIWTEVLSLDRIGIQDDFLELGGDSVQAARIGARVRDKTGYELTLVDFLDRSTIANHAAMIDEAAPAQAAGDDLTDLSADGTDG